jgi:hypothetical protein
VQAFGPSGRTSPQGAPDKALGFTPWGRAPRFCRTVMAVTATCVASPPLPPAQRSPGRPASSCWRSVSNPAHAPEFAFRPLRGSASRPRRASGQQRGQSFSPASGDKHATPQRSNPPAAHTGPTQEERVGQDGVVHQTMSTDHAGTHHRHPPFHISPREQSSGG